MAVQFGNPCAAPVGARRQWLETDLGPGLGPMQGFSRSTERTFFHLPHLKLGLDAAGMCGVRPQTVLLTHGHIDHSADIWWAAGRDGGATLYVPSVIQAQVEAYIVAQRRLNWGTTDTPLHEQCRIVGVTPGQEPVPLAGHEGRWMLQVFEMSHMVPCVGYGLIAVRKRLKPAYIGMPGKDIGALRRGGTEVEEVYHAHQLAYLGDTSIDVFRRHPEILANYATVIVECTFIDFFVSDTSQSGPDGALTLHSAQQRCCEHGHILWSQLQPLVQAHPATRFILIHFSLRYTAAQVRDFFEAQHLNNVTVMCSEFQQ